MHIFGSVFGKTVAAAAIAGSVVVGGGMGHKGDDNRPAQIKQAAVVQKVDIHINSAGKVEVRGAKVTAVSGNTITATTAVGSTTLTWTINTDRTTKFAAATNTATTTANVHGVVVGDTVSFNGALASGGSLVVNAKVVHDLSAKVLKFEDKLKVKIEGREGTSSRDR